MYKNILIPIALDQERDTTDALAVARQLLAEGGRITLLSVVEEVPAYVAEYVVIKPADKVLRDAKARLEEDAKDEPDVKTDVVSGHAAVSTTKFAEDHGVDLIVVASHRPGVQEYFLGSTAARVVRHAPCAVHVVR
jgi:nucleotide-binding universal stress UspA family protein